MTDRTNLRALAHEEARDASCLSVCWSETSHSVACEGLTARIESAILRGMRAVLERLRSDRGLNQEIGYVPPESQALERDYVKGYRQSASETGDYIRALLSELAESEAPKQEEEK